MGRSESGIQRTMVLGGDGNCVRGHSEVPRWQVPGARLGFSRPPLRAARHAHTGVIREGSTEPVRGPLFAQEHAGLGISDP